MKLTKEEKQALKAAKQAEAKAKYDNLSKTQKRVGFGIIGLILVGMYSCSTLEPSTEAPEAVSNPFIPVAAPEAGISSAEAKTICNEAIKAETTNYTKVDINYLTDSAFLKDASGKATASIGFTIDNGQGITLPFTGYCYFNVDKSLRAFEIQNN